MKNQRQQTGRRGEDEACRFLLECGHQILERNFRISHLETDIISLDKDGVHFVEVKTRRVPASADPEENVGPVKQRRLVGAAQEYLHSSMKMIPPDAEVFFDVITVLLDGDDSYIEYYPQAFIPVYV